MEPSPQDPREFACVYDSTPKQTRVFVTGYLLAEGKGLVDPDNETESNSALRVQGEGREATGLPRQKDR